MLEMDCLFQWVWLQRNQFWNIYDVWNISRAIDGTLQKQSQVRYGKRNGLLSVL